MHFLRYLFANTLLTITLVLAASGGRALSAIPAGQPVDGIRCDAAEGVAMHIHPHLTIMDHGKQVRIPEDVGRPLGAQCLYWLHTHTPDGIVHIESPKVQTFTLGQFMDVWGEPMTKAGVGGAKPRKGEAVKVYVQGRPYAGDPRKIEFTQHLDIVVLVGPPYRVPPPFTAWNGN
ncbi:MAG: hypothetical protein NVS3B28_16120 [Candidatus Velthaea sp.]